MSDKTASATIASEDKLVVDQRLKTLVGSSLNKTDNVIIHSLKLLEDSLGRTISLTDVGGGALW